MTIAITGATGHLGRLVLQHLTRKIGVSGVIAVVRNAGKAAGLQVSVRVADYTQPAALEATLRGIDTLLLISSSEIGQRLAHHANVVAAARKAGVQRIIYTSLLRADTSPLKNLAEEHLPTEAAIKASGMQYIILRNGWYTENYTGSIAGALENGAFIGSAGVGRIASAAREDYAEAAVAALTGACRDGETYELAGDTAWTLADLAAELSRQSGRDIPYKNLPEAEYAAILQHAGLPQPMAAAVASWDVGAAQGGLFDDGRVLSHLIGRPTTPMPTTVAAALAAR